MLDIIPIWGLIMAVALLFLILGSYFDLMTAEIPDVITVGLTFIILIISLVYSALVWDFSFFISSASIGILYFILGYILFYLGEWGGGDVKLISGVGCSIGFLGAINYLKESILPYYIDYLINMAIVSAPYLIIYALILGLMKPSVFNRFYKTMRNIVSIFVIIISFIPSISALFLNLKSIALIYLLIPALVILSIYLKAVEKEALQKRINVSELQVGDVLAEDLIVNGEKIFSSRNISGLERKDIERIKTLSKEGKIPTEITIKWGVKFSPIFLFAFLLSISVGNALETIVMYLCSI